MNDAILLLETLYRPDDLLTIRPSIGAGIIGKTIRPVSEWITYFRNGGKTTEHIIPNPMTGQEGMTKTGKPSFQCDETVKIYRFCVVEFDDISRADQLKFWSGVKLPIVALIDSGGKSIHGWLDVQKLAKIETFDQWTTQIKNRLYDRYLTPMGVDSSCSNPSRLSRLPGHYRSEKQAWQRLLWLSPEGRMVFS